MSSNIPSPAEVSFDAYDNLKADIAKSIARRNRTRDVIQSLSNDATAISTITPARPTSSPVVGTKPGNTPVGDMSPKQFSLALLQKLGIKANSENLRGLDAWMRAEGGNWKNAAKYNPMNTTLNLSGSRSMNSVGVKAYQNWQQGLDATYKTLTGGNGRYNSVLKALSSGSANDIANAVISSPWGTGDLMKKILG